MIRQDSPEIKDFRLTKGGDRWYDSACALSSVFHIVEQEIPIAYSVNDIKSYAKEMFKKGFLDKALIVAWDGCFLALGLKTETRFEGPGYQCKSDEREVLELRKPGYTHFVPGDGSGHYSWDSLGHRDTQKDYQIHSKRIIKIKGVI